MTNECGKADKKGARLDKSIEPSLSLRESHGISTAGIGK